MSYGRDFGFNPEDEDVGIFYTRDKHGRLRSPPGYGPSTVCTADKTYLQDHVKPAECSVALQDGLHNPQSLFPICLDFVAKNVTMVESLQDFPEIVGKQLFQKVIANQGFDKKVSKTLPLFCEAYGDLVLNKLCLRGEYVTLNNKVDCLQYFVCLSELDVSHCKLGRSHELLTHISNMHGLMKLNLKDNCLGDADIAQITLPLRMMGSGLAQLTMLDLSCNRSITDKVFKCLAKLPGLTDLNLSGTRIVDVTDLVSRTKLYLSSDDAVFKHSFTISEGWAVPLIEHWIANSKSNAFKMKTQPRNKDHTMAFYDSKAKRDILRNRNKAKKDIRDKKFGQPIIILKADNCLGDKLTDKANKNCYSNLDIAQATRKRKYLEYCSNGEKNQKKNTTSSRRDRTGQDEEEDILQSYVSCGGQEGSGQKKLCLFDAMDSNRWG